MTLDEQYALAALPGRGPGLNDSGLFPLAVGHYLVLSRIQSPLLTSPDKLECGDLAVARFICSRKWQKSWSAIQRKKKRWKIEWESYVFQSSAIHRHNKWMELIRWWSYHTKGIEAWETDGNGAKLPVIHSIKRVLMGEMGMTLTDLMDLPFKSAVSDCVCYSAGSGNSGGLITDSERQYMEQKKKVIHGVRH